MAAETDTSDINFLKIINFTKGFSSWHVQWPIGNCLDDRNSSSFSTIVKTDDESVAFRWHLGISKSQLYENKIYFGLYPRELQTFLPVILRLTLQIRDDRRQIFSHGCMRVYSSLNHGCGCYLPIEDARSLHDDYDELIVHCWIDIPNDILKFNLGTPTKLDYDAVKEFAERSSKSKTAFDVDESEMGEDENVDTNSSSRVTLAILDQNNKETRRFNCDGRVLARRSDVFRRMFANKEWKESGDKDERYVEIKDENIDDRTMEAVLNYANQNRFPDKECPVLYNIIYAADKYDLPELIEWCVNTLICFFGGDRLEQLILADRHRLPQLKAVCVASVSMNLSVLETGEMREGIDAELMSDLIKDSARRQTWTEDIIVGTTK